MDTSGLLDEALKKCSATKFTGVLRVAGDPGGTVQLVGGGIAACQTPGAPSLEVVLLRSGVISEDDWDAAFSASATAGRPMAAELVDRGLVGGGELEALLRITLADCVFALLAGTIDACDAQEGPVDCLLPLRPASKPGWLLAEATRRAQVLASMPGPAIGARDRLTVAPRAKGKDVDDIRAVADGRRTARDLAFVLGRGLYATLLLLTRMHTDKLVVVAGASTTRGRATALPQRHKDTAALVRPRSERSTKPDRA
jgi:hypothetical protein